MKESKILLFCMVVGVLAKITTATECGLPTTRSGNTKIVGGVESQAGKWPWQAALEISNSVGGQVPICGGTLIDNKWVVTAAHCTIGFSKERVKILLGVFDYQSASDVNANTYAIDEIINHPNYNPVNLDNDIALIRLAGEVVYTDYISPACLPGENEDVAVNTSCWITGWGDTQDFNLAPFTTLREAVVPIISNTLCDDQLSIYNISISQSHICAGFTDGGVDTCQGDSGGPLVCERSGTSMFELHGITSFGIGCGLKLLPGVYTRVSQYVDWINSTMNMPPEEDPFFSFPETPCGSIITTASTLKLPLISATQLYEPDLTCTWTLNNSGGAGTAINIFFIERFLVEPAITGIGCKDSVRILRDDGTQVGQDLCGYNLPFPVTIPYEESQNVQVIFTSDGSIQLEGFAMNVTFGESWQICGRRQVSTTTRSKNLEKNQEKIVGGEEAERGEWPWQALLEVVDPVDSLIYPICGGTLIDSKWVVTAAHCTVGLTAERLKVHLGIHTYGGLNHFKPETYSVSEIINHEGYSDADTLRNDISLLKLAGNVVFRSHIVPACLPNSADAPAVNSSCWITGWGDTQDLNLPSFSTLREAAVPVISNAQCQSYLNEVTIDQTHLCAGFSDGGVDTCQGDSGGPLVCENSVTSAYVLHGVTSFGFGCANPMSPGVYTRVTEYVDWLTLNTQNNAVTDPFFSIPETSCSSIITTNDTLRIPLLGETQLYQSNWQCTWTLRNDLGANTSINIEFVGRFLLESAPGGCFDKVTLVGDNGNEISRELCGFTLPDPISVSYETSQEVRVMFTSDTSNEFEGFAIKVTFGAVLESNNSAASECGRSRISLSSRSKNGNQNKIVGGAEAEHGKWPWQAILEITNPDDGSGRKICGGTLIDSKHVITAAHCTSGTPPEQLKIYLGVFNAQSPEPTTKLYSVASIINHPGYDDSTVDNDISVIRLAGEVVYSDYISPACLPGENEDVAVNTSCWITGWGDTQDASIPSFSTLQEAEVPVISNFQCQTYLSARNPQITIPDSQLCAGFSQGGVDTCQGDSGGPLVCESSVTSAYVLHGVTSYGFGCANPMSPGVYTRVTKYVDWINSNTQNVAETDPFFSIPETPCNSIITSNETLRLPLLSETQLYTPNYQCTWIIRSGAGTSTTINLQFVERFLVEPTSNSGGCFDYIQILGQDGGVIVNSICGYSLPNPVIVENTQEVRVTFHSDASVQYEGFAMQVVFGTFEPATDPFFLIAETPSGSIIKTNSTLRLPLVPGTAEYAENFHCTWTLRNDLTRVRNGFTSGSIINIAFVERFLVEPRGTDACYDYVRILDAYGIRIGSDLCGYTLPNPITISGSQEVTVVFQSDSSIEFEGFAIQVSFGIVIQDAFFSIPETPCGSIITNDSTLRLPVDPVTQLYRPGTICTWTLSNGVSGLFSVISITFVNRFQVEPFGSNDCFDKVRILNDNGEQIESDFCGYTLPDPITVYGSQHVTVEFSSDSSVQDQGFAIEVAFGSMSRTNGSSFTSIPETACGSVITTNGSLRLPLNPTTQAYAPNFECTWTLRNSADRSHSVINITFIILFLVEPRFSGCYDYVRITAENGDQVGSDLCGFELPGPVSIENSQQVSVKFVSDSTVQYEGFAIDVTFGSNSEPADLFFTIPEAPCDSTINTNGLYRLPLVTGTLQYASNLVCLWTLRSPLATRTSINITFVERFRLEPLGSSSCYDYVRIRNETGHQVGRDLCGYTLPDPVFITDSQLATVTFISDSTVEYEGFAMQVTFQEFQQPGINISDPFFSIPETPCGVVVTSNYTLRLPLVALTQQYAPNFVCSWTLRNLLGPDSAINIEFVERFMVEPRGASSCYDYVEIRKGNGNQIGNNMCGQFLPSPITIHGSQEVRVTFRSDSTVQFEGFAIRVTFGRPITEDICDKLMVHLTDEAEYNINTPGFPFEFSPRNSDCLYEFIAQQGYRVEVILDVDTTSCCDFLEVFEGNIIIGAIRGDVDRTLITSSGSYLSLRYFTSSSQAIQSRGFQASYRQFQPNCEGRLVAGSYPQNLEPVVLLGASPTVECIWTIETDVGHQVLLHINRLGAAETVEITDHVQSLGSFTSLLLPAPVISSSSNQVKVRLSSLVYGNPTFSLSYISSNFVPCDASPNACSDAVSTCQSTLFGTICLCDVGYVGTGAFCQDINECASALFNPSSIDFCDFAAICTNTQGSFLCQCLQGYSGNGTYCEDIDECELQETSCGGNATCFNQPGSYSCSCNDGFTGDGIVCTNSDSGGHRLHVPRFIILTLLLILSSLLTFLC